MAVTSVPLLPPAYQWDQHQGGEVETRREVGPLRALLNCWIHSPWIWPYICTSCLGVMVQFLLFSHFAACNPKPPNWFRWKNNLPIEKVVCFSHLPSLFILLSVWSGPYFPPVDMGTLSPTDFPGAECGSNVILGVEVPHGPCKRKK